MKKSKLLSYNLTGSIHTIGVESADVINDIEEVGLSECVQIVAVRKSGTLYKINPNVLQESKHVCSFIELVEFIFDKLNIKEYKIRRVDFRLDSYDTEHYADYAKLNRYLISALATAYEVKNCYKTVDLFTEYQLSVAIKNADFEAEHYDRSRKNEITGNEQEQAKSRLEFRLKAHNKNKNGWKLDDLDEIVFDWKNRFLKALESLDETQKRYNEALYQEWIDNREYYLNLKHFILSNRNRIFTTGQAIELLTKIGVEHPDTYIRNLKSRNKIEMFAKRDVEHVLAHILNEMYYYFSE